MRQIVPKATWTAGFARTTSYAGVLDGAGDGFSVSITYGQVCARVPVARASTFRNLAVFTRAAFGAPVTVTLMVEDAPSALVVTLTPGATFARTAGPDVSVAAGQDISYRYQGPTVGSPGLPLAMCVEREGDDQVFGVAGVAGTPTVGAGWFGGAFGNGVLEAWTGTAPLSNTYSLCAIPGAVTGLCLRAYGGAPGAGVWTGWLQKNGVRQDGTGGTVDTATVLTGTATVAQRAFSLPGALYDHFDLLILRSGTGGAFATANVAAGVAYTPGTPGAFMLCGGSNDNLNPSATTPFWKWTRSSQFGPTEGDHAVALGSGSLAATGLYVETDPRAPGVTRVYTLRRNEADTPIAATVSGAATTGSGVAAQAYEINDLIALQGALSGTTAAGPLHWGVAAGFVTPPAAAHTRIRRLRRAPHLSADQAEQFFAKFQLDFAAGVGNAADPGYDPQLYLRWSDDGGQTWRGPLAVSAGLLGAFRRRAIWRRLGRGRDRVFEVSMDDPVKWALVAATLDAVKGTS